ncbi:type I restriction endonuclease subunit S [Salmonella enterica]|nr:type I restriction endonuclease subunit S [Salmonella enterica subsp. enterica serovar Florida]EDL7417936.1 type I restriction endonuclease subunit S [Salmonella enterica]EEG1558652.1 type I restriction endonuclease subunit S [Salmonella enterica subsp. enterica serovar Midway]EEH1320759.1 type I restriction endonuclease subunit S [Salmonella enterica subsp. enterica serovar Midway]EKA1616958.1 restriction endonuclease subunit S [Salmonella enterica]
MSNAHLPQGWCISRISDISMKGDQRKPAEEEPLIYVDIGSINRDSKIIESPQKLMGKDAPSRARKVINTGDVLVSLTRPNLNAVALVPSELDNQIASTGFEVIKSVLVDSRYIFALTRSKDFIDSISGAVQGALYPAAKSSDVQAYKFPLPPLSEQKIIADKVEILLSQVEAIKARLERILNILKTFGRSVLTAAVRGGLTEDWRREHNISLEGWLSTNVGSVAEVTTGKTPKRTISEYWEGGTIPWLTSAVTGSTYTMEAEQFVTELAVKECTLKIFPKGTLLMAMYGEGKTRGQVTEIRLEATCNQACAAILVDETKISKEFLKICLQESYEETRKAAVGGAQPNLNLNKVREIPVWLPGKLEQRIIVHRIEEFFTYSDSIEKKLNASLTRVNNLTQFILAKAFRGELTTDWRISNPELVSGENSAKALLEKIKAEREAIKNKPKRSVVKKNTGSHMGKKIIKVVEALKQAGEPLSGQRLLAAAGYPDNSNTEQLELFFLDLRDALAIEKSIVKLERSEDGQDWFALAKADGNE